MTSAEEHIGDDGCADYFAACMAIMRRIHETQRGSLARAAVLLADQVVADHLIYIYGPGGHSALAAQELFYRAGGLMHIAPIFDQGTSLAAGALRSTAMERLSGYGRVVIEQVGLGKGDLLLLVNAFGVNAAVIDAARAARSLGATVIGMNSHAAAERIPAAHPARHPSGANLHEIVDVAIDTDIPDGDAAVSVAGIDAPLGPVSTFANAFALNTLALRTIAILARRGVTPPIWRSRNASAGDRNDATAIDAMRRRIASL